MTILMDPLYRIPKALLPESPEARGISPARRHAISRQMAREAAEALLEPLSRHGCEVTHGRTSRRGAPIGSRYVLRRGERHVRLQVAGSSNIDYLGWRHPGSYRAGLSGADYDLLLLVDTGVAWPTAAEWLDRRRFPSAGTTAEYYLFTIDQVRLITKDRERWNANEVWIGAWRNRLPGVGTKEHRRQYNEIWTPLHRNALHVIEEALD